MSRKLPSALIVLTAFLFVATPAALATDVTVLGGILAASLDVRVDQREPFSPGWHTLDVEGNVTSTAAPVIATYALPCSAGRFDPPSNGGGAACSPGTTVRAAGHQVSVGPPGRENGCASWAGTSGDRIVPPLVFCAIAAQVDDQEVRLAFGYLCLLDSSPGAAYPLYCIGPVAYVRSPDSGYVGAVAFLWKSPSDTCIRAYSATGGQSWDGHIACLDDEIVTIDDGICVALRAMLDGEPHEVPPSCVKP